MRVVLDNVGVIKHCDVEFVPGVNLIIGSSGSGKSTLMRCIYNMATNGFSDGNISFSKNSMRVSIAADNDVIEYVRNKRTNGDRFFYVVNGETYTKVGRSVPKPVSDILKISDVEINNENVNFNFNLQFSEPFLIIGNQATLYNVLTYRSTGDVSAINDYYVRDIKENASEIKVNQELKERLEETLKGLEKSEKKLRPIEKLYSSYTEYKHGKAVLEDLEMYRDKLYTLNKFSAILDSLNHNESLCKASITECSDAIELHRLVDGLRELQKVADHEAILNESILTHDKAIREIADLDAVKKLFNSMVEASTLRKSIIALSGCIEKCNASICVKETLDDLCKLHSDLGCLSEYNEVLDLELKHMELEALEGLHSLSTLSNNLLSVNLSIAGIADKMQEVNTELASFKVCPLCLKPLDFSDGMLQNSCL